MAATNKSQKRSYNRPIHKRIALHPISIFLLLCVGVVIGMSAMPTKADSYVITAKVSTPAVTAPAIITSYQDQEHTTNPIAVISGTCSTDTAYVNVTLDGTSAGTSECGNGFFSVTVTLQPGANSLMATAFNSTDDPGPTSPTIIVFYDVATPAIQSITPPSSRTSSAITPTTNTATSPVSPAPSISAFALTNDYHYQIHHPGEMWRWNIQISGGTPPYSITVKWGDGSILPSQTVGQNININHSFNQSGIYHITVSASDANGQSTSLQLLAVVQPYPVVPSVISSIAQDIRTYLWVIWPAYGVVTLMVASFWLGESEGVAVAIKTQLFHKFKIHK